MEVWIDGVNITQYIAFQGVKWSRNDIDGPNAGRNMEGTMIRDRVATKIRLDIKCRPLTNEEHRLVLNRLTPEFVTVMYDDPQDGRVTRVMYANNNSSEFCIKKPNGVEYWHNVTFPLVEQ